MSRVRATLLKELENAVDVFVGAHVIIHVRKNAAKLEEAALRRLLDRHKVKLKGPLRVDARLKF